MEPQQLSQDEIELAYIKTQADILRSQQNKAVLAQKDEPFSIGGVPVVPTAINAALTGIGAAGGAAAGTVGGTPGIGTLAGASAGAALGNYAAQKANQALGYEQGSPTNPMDFKGGQMAAAAMTGPIGVSAQVAKGAVPFVNRIVGDALMNQAAGDAQTLIDERRLMTPDERKLALAGSLAGTLVGRVGAEYNDRLPADMAALKRLKSERDANLAMLRASGYKRSALMAHPESNFANMVEGTGGKADMTRTYIAADQKNTNRLAALDMGLDPRDPISTDSFTIAKQWPQEIYNYIDSFGPKFEKLRADAQAAREQAQLKWMDHNNPLNSQHSVTLEEAKRAAETADNAVADLHNALKAIGQEEMIPAYEKARTKFAKIFIYEKAHNPVTGDISVPELASKLDAKTPMDGNLKQIYNASQLLERETKEGAKQLPVGAGKAGGLEGAAAGYAFAGVPGMFAGKILGHVGSSQLRNMANRIALSEAYQNRYFTPNYGQPVPAGFINFAQKAAIAAGRPNDYLAPFLQQPPQ